MSVFVCVIGTELHTGVLTGYLTGCRAYRSPVTLLISIKHHSLLLLKCGARCIPFIVVHHPCSDPELVCPNPGLAGFLFSFILGLSTRLAAPSSGPYGVGPSVSTHQFTLPVWKVGTTYPLSAILILSGSGLLSSEIRDQSWSEKSISLGAKIICLAKLTGRTWSG